MGRLHLMHQRFDNTWYILEEGVDSIPAMLDGKVAATHAEDIAQAEDLEQLLLGLHASGDDRWYVETGWRNSKGTTREEEYPHHREIHILKGFIPEICRIRTRDSSYLWYWEVVHVSALWVMTDSFTLTKVRNFTEKTRAAVDAYMEENGLLFE